MNNKCTKCNILISTADMDGMPTECARCQIDKLYEYSKKGPHVSVKYHNMWVPISVMKSAYDLTAPDTLKFGETTKDE